jgi:hypothetical protein
MANPHDIITQLTAGTNTNSLASTVGQVAGDNEGLRGLNTQLDQLRTLFQQQTNSTKENTEAITRATNTSSSAFANSLGDAAKSTGSSLSGGFFLSPVLSGLFKLFGRNHDTEAPPPLPAFSLPSAFNVDGSVTPGGIAPTQYGQDGLPRPTINSTPAQPAITVQVNAMDARSFLDRSDDIARAVKQAMLHSHSVNDVMGEL